LVQENVKKLTEEEWFNVLETIFKIKLDPIKDGKLSFVLSDNTSDDYYHLTAFDRQY